MHGGGGAAHNVGGMDAPLVMHPMAHGAHGMNRGPPPSSRGTPPGPPPGGAPPAMMMPRGVMGGKGGPPRGPPPGPPPRGPAVAAAPTRGPPPRGPPPGPPPGAPSQAPPAPVKQAAVTNDLQWDDVDSNASDGEEGAASLGGLLGDYGSDEEEGEEQDAPVLVRQVQAAAAATAAGGGRVAAAAAPQITKAPTGGQATHRAPKLEKKSLDQVQIDPAMMRLVPGAVQRRRVAPASRGVKRKATGPVAPAPVAKPAGMAFAAAVQPVQPPPPPGPPDEFADFMSEINGL